MKHGYREGSVFPKPLGNPAQINEHGQKVLDKILNHPEKIVKQYINSRYGPVIEIESPDIGGARFTGDGKEMMGFMEPYWLKK
jgi:filamentous hemagglutinin